MHKALTWLGQSELQERVHLKHQHCLKMKQEGWQWPEQRLDAEEVKNREQMPRNPGDTGQVLLHCETSGDTRDQQNC